MTTYALIFCNCRYKSISFQWVIPMRTSTSCFQKFLIAFDKVVENLCQVCIYSSIFVLYNCTWILYVCVLLDLVQKIHTSFKPNPEVQLLEGVWDFKEWMKPFLGKVEHHSKYHVFRFTKTSSKVYMLSSCCFRLTYYN